LLEVEQLLPYELPVLGAVDRDVFATDPPESIRPYVTVWPTADIEGLFVFDPAAIQVMISSGLLKKEFQTIAAVNDILGELLEGQKDNAVAEMAQRILREAANLQWPSPRGESPITRLREATNAMVAISSTEVEEAIDSAEAMWDTHQADLWTMCAGRLSSQCSQIERARYGQDVPSWKQLRERVLISRVSNRSPLD
jgi:hypothetical protein